MKVEKLKELGLVGNRLAFAPVAESIGNGRITRAVGHLIIGTEEVRHGETDCGDENQHGAHTEPEWASSLGAEVRDERDHA